MNLASLVVENRVFGRCFVNGRCRQIQINKEPLRKFNDGVSVHLAKVIVVVECNRLGT